MSNWEWKPVETFVVEPDDAVGSRRRRRQSDAVVDEMVNRLHRRLLDELEIPSGPDTSDDERRDMVTRAARQLLAEEAPTIAGFTRDEIIERLLDEVLGLGPIQELVDDPSISEIMVNTASEVYVEREGRIYETPVRFRDDEHVYRVIQRIVAPLGRRIDESSPMVDARLPDGSRVNVIIPPLSPKGPVITIRKFRTDRMTIDDLVRIGTLPPWVAEFLEACVQARLNVLVSGGTGTGKTTLLNALSAYIPGSERIVTIEDPTELRLQQRHVISLEARPSSMEGRGEVTQRELLRNALRMRPDRIIIGEVRGGEAFDMLQAMNTGHEGSISTIHANSPRDALSRLENMVLMARYELPVTVVREQMASALDLIVQIARLSDGVRRVVQITEVAGMEGSVVTTQDLMKFRQEGLDAERNVIGAHQPTGIRPRFVERFAAAGLEYRPEWFLQEMVR